MRRPRKIRGRHAGLGKRCGVKGFVPPRRLVEIADERTEGMVVFYVFSGDRGNIEHLKRLARSCYMQGVNDTIDSLARSGIELVQRKEKKV